MNYNEYYSELEIQKLLKSLGEVNESFGFSSIYEIIKKYVTNLFNTKDSNFFTTINSLWKKMKKNEKYCYILISILTITCGIPKVEIFKNLDNDPKVIEIADMVEKDNKEQKTHVVKKGESLVSISKLYDMYYTDLIHKNKLTTTTIQPGQVLLLPNESERDIYNLEAKPEDFEEIQFGVKPKEEPKPEEVEKPIEIEDELPEVLVDNGIFMHPSIVNKRVPSLEIAPFNKVNAIVIHRTATKNTKATIRGFAKSKIGTQFLIDFDGTIYQTAGIDKMTYHVGEIRSRAAKEKKASKEEIEILKKIGWSPKKIHYHEIKKPYPVRYPHNTDAIGIEIMGGYDKSTGKWQNLTFAQIRSIKFLIKLLKRHFSLTEKDIYAHEEISYKTHDEGGYVINTIK